MYNLKRYMFSLLIIISMSPVIGLFFGFLLTAVITLFIAARYFQFQRGIFHGAILLLLSMTPMLVYDVYLTFNEKSDTWAHIAIFSSVVLGFVVASSSANGSYLDDFEQAFLPLAILSLIFYIIFWIFPDLAYSFFDYEYRDTNHKTLLILNVLMNPDPVLRNAGFASEPGFYQILVNIALFARLSRLNKPDYVCFFYIFIVLTTLSTTGLIVSLFLVGYKFSLKYRIYAGLAAILFLVPLTTLIDRQVETKIMNEAVAGARLTPSMNALALLKDEPFGIGSVQYIRVFDALNIGSYDSYTQIGLRFGVFSLLLLIALLIRLAREKFALAVVLGLSFLSSPIWFNPIIVACLLLAPRFERQPVYKLGRNIMARPGNL